MLSKSCNPYARNVSLGVYFNGTGLSAGVIPIESPDFIPSKSLSARFTPLKSGAEGTKQTLRRMKELAYLGARTPQIWSLTRQLVSGKIKGFKDPCPVNHRTCEAERILKWVQTHIRWTPDTADVETVAMPVRTIEVGAGDCDDVSVLAASMATSISLPVRFKAIAANKEYPNEFSHVYVQFNVGGKWISADPSIKSAPLGWEAPVYYKEMVLPIWE